MEQGVERSERSWEEAKEARRRGGERREGDLVDEGEGAKILSSKTTVLRSVPFRSSVPFLRNCCTLLALPISPKKMDGF